MSNAFPLPWPWVPGSGPVDDATFQERIQENFDKLALGLGPLQEQVNDLDSTVATLTGSPSWTAPTLVNSWADAATYLTAGYIKKPDGMVALRGTITGGGADTMFTLPVGFRPGATVRYPTTANNAFGTVQIDQNGVVSRTTGSSTNVSLDGIHFWT